MSDTVHTFRLAPSDPSSRVSVTLTEMPRLAAAADALRLWFVRYEDRHIGALLTRPAVVRSRRGVREAFRFRAVTADGELDGEHTSISGALRELLAAGGSGE